MLVLAIMTKEIKGKQKSKRKESKQNDSKAKKASTSDSHEINKRTRTSNIKEEGFYKFRNMMIRNIKLQSKPILQKVTKRGKKRGKKSGRPQK